MYPRIHTLFFRPIPTVHNNHTPLQTDTHKNVNSQPADRQIDRPRTIINNERHLFISLAFPFLSFIIPASLPHGCVHFHSFALTFWFFLSTGCSKQQNKRRRPTQFAHYSHHPIIYPEQHPAPAAAAANPFRPFPFLFFFPFLLFSFFSCTSHPPFQTQPRSLTSTRKTSSKANQAHPCEFSLFLLFFVFCSYAKTNKKSRSRT